MEKEEVNFTGLDQTAKRRHAVILLLVCIPILFLSLLAVTPILQPSSAGDAPDMLVTPSDISFSKMDTVAEEPFTAYARIRNIGGSEGTATAKFYLDLVGSPQGDDAGLVGEMNVTVPPGGSSIASLSLSLPSGVYEVSAHVVDVAPEDADLTNNVASTTIEVFPSQELVHFSSPTLLLKSINVTIQSGTERVVPLTVTVLGGPAKGVTVIVLDSEGLFAEPASPPVDVEEGTSIKVYLRISVPDIAQGTSVSKKELLVQAVGSNAKGNSAVVTLFVHPPVTSTSWWNSTTATFAVLGVLAAVLAAINSVEWGKYKFLGVILPLYTKLKKEDVLNQYTRGKIHGYLVANPGDYFNSIAKALGISSGNLAYHLRVLEREGEIASKKDGVYKRFYPRGAKMGPSRENELSSVQKSIFDAIKETPGIKQKDIASLLGVTSSTVSYHLQKLVATGLIRARRKGMAIRYHVKAERIDNSR